MIPKIIHYCWFGRGEMPELALKCIESWHKYMPDYEYKLWNEDNFDINSYQYTKEAYSVKKYAFVSDVARLKALADFGGVYFDTDVLVFKSFEPLLIYKAFAGFEGSKHCPIGTCVIGSEKNGTWVRTQLEYYKDRHFISQDGVFDITTNVSFITEKMKERGLISNGKEQDVADLHVLPVDFFCPRHTTGEYIKTANTFSDHLGIGSWSESKTTWKKELFSLMNPKLRVSLVKLKRKIIG